MTEAVDKTRGELLYERLAPEGTDAAVEALAREAQRTVDRLDDLDRIIHGDGVVQLLRFRVGADTDWDAGEVHVTVTFDQVLAEARQQGVALRGLLASLNADKGVVPSAGPVQRSVLDELRERRERNGTSSA